MTTLQNVAQSKNAIDLMAHRGYHLDFDEHRPGIRDVVCGSHVAILSLVAFDALPTNGTLAYSIHVETDLTNQILAMSHQDSGWFVDEDTDLAEFLALMNIMMEQCPSLVTPADEEQLARIADLVANVEV